MNALKKIIAWFMALFTGKKQEAIKPVEVPDKQPTSEPIKVVPDPIIIPTVPPIVIDPIMEVKPEPVIVKKPNRYPLLLRKL
jgi:hypothetical protein